VTQLLVPETGKRSFLPVIDRPLDNTAMSAYMTCPREYYFGMVQHRRGAGKSPALVYGSLWHKIMEYHYKSNGDVELVRYVASKSWEGHDAADDYRTLKRGLLDYDRYRKQYGDKPSDESSGRTVGTVGDMLVELGTNAQGDDLLHPWAGKLDRIIEIDGLYYVEDHKTTSRLDKWYFQQFELSNQMMGYTYLAKALLPMLTVVGVRINLAHVLTEKSAFLRQLVNFNPNQLKRWTEQTNIWMKKLELDYVAAAAEGFPLVPEVAFPQHFGDNGCSRKFGKCGYFGVCSSSPKLQASILEREYLINPWNPLAEDVEDAT
jgi:hypothetical protein